MESVYRQITNDLGRETKRFDQSDDQVERQQCARNYARTIAFAEGVLQAETRDFYRGPLEKLLNAARAREEVMRREADQVRKALVEEGGGARGVVEKIG